LPDLQAEIAAQAEARAAAATMLPQVCASGTAIPLAAAYAGGPGLHPVRVYSTSSGGVHNWNSLVSEWTSSDALATQLVACVGDEQRIVIEVCPYNGPDITRYRYTIDVRLVAVQSGQVVASTVLVGADPRNCRQTEPYELVTLNGSQVQSSQLVDWLRPYVSP
jgi:hypothetical protein